MFYRWVLVKVAHSWSRTERFRPTQLPSPMTSYRSLYTSAGYKYLVKIAGYIINVTWNGRTFHASVLLVEDPITSFFSPNRTVGSLLCIRKLMAATLKWELSFVHASDCGCLTQLSSLEPLVVWTGFRQTLAFWLLDWHQSENKWIRHYWL